MGERWCLGSPGKRLTIFVNFSYIIRTCFWIRTRIVYYYNVLRLAGGRGRGRGRGPGPGPGPEPKQTSYELDLEYTFIYS